MPKRTGAKSVSFHNESKHSSPEAGEERLKLGPKQKSKIPTLRRPWAAVPYLHGVVLYAMFKSGLTSNVSGGLVAGFLALVPVQVVNSVFLLSSVAKKHHNEPLLVGSSLFISAILSLPVFIALLLFGAPLADHLAETYLLALHLSVITFHPLLVLFKIDFEAFTSIFYVEKVYRTIFSNPVLSSSFMALIGTWIGVLPIPLDWDRPWQQWPITLLSGAYIGSIVGGILTIAVAPHHKPKSE